MKKLLLIGMLLLAAAPAGAHEVLHSASEGRAIVVTLTHDDGDPFSFEQYELFRPGGSAPCQTGKTDDRGRIVFVPDTDGDWHIRAFSRDGHGADFTVNAAAVPVAGDSRSLNRPEKILIGVGCILGIFGIISLGTRRRRA